MQQQGERRIVVQLPGVQDPSRVKEILQATATLEYRPVDTEHSVADAVNGKVPFDFTLKVNLEKREEDQTAVHIDFDGKVGAMLAMMAKRPLTNLVNHMVERIKHHHD